jgi:hypothetical protein
VKYVIAAVLAVALLAVAFALIGTAPAPTPPVSFVSACVARGVLPDSACTPGAADPAVTQQNIRQTICVSGYTRTVRPPTSYTNPLKIEQMRAYGFTGSPRDYEEDHLIPLELGGAPRDPRNLWPEPRASIGGRAESKDQIENALHADVCAGRMLLADAQQRIATNWTTAR